MGKIAGAISPVVGAAGGHSGIMGNILGTISPAYGAATGHGLFGKMMTSLFGEGKHPTQPMAPNQPDQGNADIPQVPKTGDDEYVTNLLKSLGVYGRGNSPTSS